jgi:hypothetical protein
MPPLAPRSLHARSTTSAGTGLFVAAAVFAVIILLFVLRFWIVRRSRRRSEGMPTFFEVNISQTSRADYTPAPRRSDFPTWGESGVTSHPPVEQSIPTLIVDTNFDVEMAKSPMSMPISPRSPLVITPSSPRLPRVSTRPPRLSLRLPSRISIVPSLLRGFGVRTPSTARSTRSSRSWLKSPSTARSSRFGSTRGSPTESESLPPMPKLPPSARVKNGRMSYMSNISSTSSRSARSTSSKKARAGKSRLSRGSYRTPGMDDGTPLASDNAMNELWIALSTDVGASQARSRLTVEEPYVHPMNRARSMHRKKNLVSPSRQ